MAHRRAAPVAARRCFHKGNTNREKDKTKGRVFAVLRQIEGRPGACGRLLGPLAHSLAAKTSPVSEKISKFAGASPAPPPRRRCKTISPRRPRRATGWASAHCETGRNAAPNGPPRAAKQAGRHPRAGCFATRLRHPAPPGRASVNDFHAWRQGARLCACMQAR